MYIHDDGFIYAKGEELNAVKQGRHWPFDAEVESRGVHGWLVSCDITPGSFDRCASHLSYRVRNTPEARAWLRLNIRINSAPGPYQTDGPPRIRSELGGLMGPGYQATGYTPRQIESVPLDDPTGDDIAGDVK